MDRQGISSPVFHDNNGAKNYITKMPIFRLQRAMRGIERLTIDINQREARTTDYIDTKLDAQLDDIRHVLQVFFLFVIFKAETLKSQVFGAATRCKYHATPSRKTS